MRYVIHAGVTAATLLIFGLFSATEAAAFCTCEDRDEDGRFGVVLHTNGDEKVIKPNHGTYYACESLKAGLNECRQRGGFCACEDRDEQGQFGVVLYQKAKAVVISPNRGTYYDCTSSKSNLEECTQGSNYCACEDHDNDGRFGVVLYGQTTGRVTHPNQGNYYQCTSFKTSLGACKEARNYCSCEDRDKDGRFGVVLYTGVNQNDSEVIRPNQGTYYHCVSLKADVPQCR